MTNKIELPKSVRVGYATYKIEEWPVELANAAARHSECDKLNHIIRVRTDMKACETANSLLHEILHAIWNVGAIDSGDEEKCVTIFANQLIQIMQDNPVVMDWITKNARTL